MSVALQTSPFFRLHKRLQTNIVTRLGWRQLRPVQELAIEPIQAGHNALILAPTAGGKTESALFPLLDDLLRKPPTTTAILYLSPLRALLNNQEERMELLASLAGLSAFKWHGEVERAEKTRFLKEPSALMLLTPESLEVIVSNRNYCKNHLFGDLRAVVVDEIHAFAGDDRGDHLVALLARLQKTLERDFQRVGLSATVGNPQELLDWFAWDSDRAKSLVDPGRQRSARRIEIRPCPPEDDRGFLGALLARGKKSLLFTDSRNQAEKMQRTMASQGVEVLCHHSSLSKEVRDQTEQRFRFGSNCCIVCTSTLELGLDVGDLDLVMQADAPYSVSAFLQRLGRTGRRAGKQGHMAFLADDQWSFLRACSLVKLASEGFVEPVVPSTRSYHVFVQQLLLKVLEGKDVSVRSLLEGGGQPFCFRDISPREQDEMVSHLLALGVIAKRDSRLIFGPEGEKRFARGNFLDLYTVFQAGDQMTVVTRGQRPLGTVEGWFVQSLGQTGFVFSLGGRAWHAIECDWERGVLTVEPSIGGTSPAWTGPPRPLSNVLAEQTRQLLAGVSPLKFLDERAQPVLTRLRQDWGELASEAPLVERRGSRLRILTFAGGRANNLLGRWLEFQLATKVTTNNFWLSLKTTPELLADVLKAVQRESDLLSVTTDLPRGKLSKFQDLLPPELERRFLLERLYDVSQTLELVGRLKSARWSL